MKGLSLISLALLLYAVGSEHILQGFLCLEVTLLNLTASFFLHHWAMTKFPSALYVVGGRCFPLVHVQGIQADWDKRYHLRVLMIFFYCWRKLQLQSDSQAPKALSLLVIIIFLCLKKRWVIWAVQTFIKTACKHPSH